MLGPVSLCYRVPSPNSEIMTYKNVTKFCPLDIRHVGTALLLILDFYFCRLVDFKSDSGLQSECLGGAKLETKFERLILKSEPDKFPSTSVHVLLELIMDVPTLPNTPSPQLTLVLMGGGNPGSCLLCLTGRSVGRVVILARGFCD